MHALVQYGARELAKAAWLSAALFTFMALYVLMLSLQKRKNFRKLTRELGYQMPEIKDALLGHMNEHTSPRKQAEWYARFGKIYGFYDCDKAHLRVADLGVINEIFLKQSRLFDARTWLEYRLTPFNAGILFSFNKRWRHARRLFNSAMSIYRMSAHDEANRTSAELQKGIVRLLDHFERLISAPDEAPSAAGQGGRRAVPNYTEIERTGYVPLRDANSPTGYSIDIKAHTVMEVIALDIILRLGLDVHEIDVLDGLRNPMMQLIESWIHAVDDPLTRLATAIPLLRLIMPLYLLFNKSYLSYRNFMEALFRRHNEDLVQGERQRGAERPAPVRCSSKVEPVSIFRTLVAECRAGRMRKSEVIGE